MGAISGKKDRLTFNEIKILYLIRSVKRYKGSTNHLQELVNIEGGSFDVAFNRLLGTYIEEVRKNDDQFLKLTERGEEAIRFLRIPNYILPSMYFVGIFTLVLGFYTIVFPVALLPILSWAVVAIGSISMAGATGYIILSRNYAKEFLKVQDRPPLTL